MIGPFVFLDIDGVLNSHNRHANGYCGCDIESVKILNSIVEVTGAKIVVASAWRYFVLRGEMNVAGLGGLLCTHGVRWGSVIDILGPDLPDGNGGADRGLAIKRWFRERFGIAHACCHLAIDDMDLGYTKHGVPFFKTEPDKGLGGSVSREGFEKIVHMLGWKGPETL